MKDKQLLNNMISSLLSYGFLLVFSIVTSQFVLISYGSEINGLLSSINQVFSYIALLEAGIGTATIRAFYQPMEVGDTEGISSVFAASYAYYRKSAKWYSLCVLVASFVWPKVIDTTLSYWTVWGVIFFHGVSSVITYWYTSTIMNYMMASGKNYINNNIHVASTLLTYVLKLCICYLEWNVIWISISLVAVNTIKCLIYRYYFQKQCSIKVIQKSADMSLLKQRNSFLIHEVSGVIFSSTDTILISIFCGLHEASIYAVYSLVTSAIRSIIGQGFNGTKYILGKAYTKGMDEYKWVHDVYNSIYICIVFILFSVAYVMLLPFIKIYTAGVTDINYIDYCLPALFVIIELLSSCRIVDNELIRIALHADKTINRTITEAIINVISSFLLVQYIGIYGVLVGTIMALLYRTNDIVIYVNHRILLRSAKKEYRLYLVNFLTFLSIMLAYTKCNIEVNSLPALFMSAVICFFVVAAVYLLINICTNTCIQDIILKRNSESKANRKSKQ